MVVVFGIAMVAAAYGAAYGADVLKAEKSRWEVPVGILGFALGGLGAGLLLFALIGDLP